MLRWSVAGLALALLLVPLPTFAPGSEVHQGPSRVFVPDEAVIGFHGAIPADVEAWLEAQGATLLMRNDATNWVSAKFPSEAATDAFLARGVGVRGDVRFVERDGYASLAMTPNDPQYGNQWGFPAIMAEQAWDITLGSHDVKVSVVDTGVRVTHPDLAANMCGPFTSTVPGSPNPDDDYGHGTHVAGTVAAVTNNALGVAGTSQACVMSARVLQFGGGQWTWIAAGVTWSVDNGADIVSMSLQGPFSQAMQDAVRYAYNQNDVLVVSAAGNWGCGLLAPVNSIVGDGTVAYPGRYDESMAVAALMDPGVLTASFSSCGKDMEIAGPGQDVLSTVPGPGYAYYSGTSMATPHVSGVAALVKSEHPDISAVALRCILDLSATDLPAHPGRDYMTGWGRLNALAALTLAESIAQAGGLGAFADACAAAAPVIFY